MRVRTLSSFMLFALNLAFAAPAYAQQPTPAQPTAPSAANAEPPIVLDASQVSGMNLERLRTAIAAETHREVVLSTDPRAPLAGDRLRVTLAGGRTRVRFESSAREREMPSEVNAEAEVRQIALLAANVVAGEADDILADLRKKKAATPTSHPPSDETESRAATALVQAREDELAYERLEGTLRYHSESHWPARLALSLTAIGTSFVTVPVGLYIRESLDERISGSALAGLGLGLFAVGTLDILWSITDDPPLRDLHRHLVLQHGTQPAGPLVRGVEKEWRDRAARGTKFLHWVGGFSLGIGVLGMAVGTGQVVTAPRDAALQDRAATGALVVGTGAIVSIFGLAMLLSPSADQSRYDAYERASKRPSVSAGVSPVPGGAAFSLSGRF